MRLVLFDIDGTLLRCGRQVARVFTACLEEVYGTAGHLEGYSFAGRTDPGIVLDLMASAGLDRDTVVAGLPRMRRLYLERLAETLDASRMSLLPGVLELLERLSAQPDVTVGLLTGNWRGGARVKLGKFGLNRFFSFGAFGEDGFVRRDLLPRALARAQRSTGRSFRPEETLLVGDSVLDVDCGRVHGVAVLAVATGFTAAADLDAAGARWVVPDLLTARDRIPMFSA
ncbi:MAG: HAD hydrolase-like protein [Acidobacteria bacterium]|nr:HAD hydrolase-like protein [Acidobacteriota bacterium]